MGEIDAMQDAPVTSENLFNPGKQLLRLPTLEVLGTVDFSAVKPNHIVLIRTHDRLESKDAIMSLIKEKVPTGCIIAYLRWDVDIQSLNEAAMNKNGWFTAEQMALAMGDRTYATNLLTSAKWGTERINQALGEEEKPTEPERRKPGRPPKKAQESEGGQ